MDWFARVRERLISGDQRQHRLTELGSIREDLLQDALWTDIVNFPRKLNKYNCLQRAFLLLVVFFLLLAACSFVVGSPPPPYATFLHFLHPTNQGSVIMEAFHRFSMIFCVFLCLSKFPTVFQCVFVFFKHFHSCSLC
jgi:hypothetical protein